MSEKRLASFIAFRMIRSSDNERISKPIVRIAMWGVAVGMALMILSLAIVKGFQSEVRNKVIGFGGHFQVVSNDDNSTHESAPIIINDSVAKKLQNIEGVAHVSKFAQKPAIAETRKGIAGVVGKGITTDYDTTFLHQSLIAGRVPILSPQPDSIPRAEILMSEFIAKRLSVKVNERMSLYIVNGEDDIQQQTFRVVGIYKTELEEYDEKFVFVPLEYVQQFGGWGVQGQIVIDTVDIPSLAIVQPLFFGKEDAQGYWNNNQKSTARNPFLLDKNVDTALCLITQARGVLNDTTYADIIWKNNKPHWSYRNLRGSEVNYIGGYEILVRDFDQLTTLKKELWEVLPYDLLLIPLVDRNPEIFSWLEMLDINVVIIVVLMVVLSIVNMTSALLILILERQNFIGSLKAMGLRNKIIYRIFIWHAASIIGKGILWGNAIGIGISLLQKYTGLIKLDPENYYVSTVPIQFDVPYILVLNAITLVVCLLAMILPSWYVATIQPASAIRKN